MTENKRFTVDDKWIKDNCIGALLNIDFNTIVDANLCCDLLNQIEKEKRNNGKLASKLLNENEQLKLLSNHRGEMVSFATSLIQDMGSEEMLKMWNDFTEIMYQKWKKKRGIK